MLASLHTPTEDAWIRAWIAEKEPCGRVAAPFQRYKGRLRAAQGYLTKMPRDFVERWPELASLAESLSGVQDELDRLTEAAPNLGSQTVGAPETFSFAPKSD